jgi:hypothetical protein
MKIEVFAGKVPTFCAASGIKTGPLCLQLNIAGNLSCPQLVAGKKNNRGRQIAIEMNDIH